MSLSSILTTTAAGLANTDYQIALANANVANASDTSYSRKTADFGAITSTVSLSTAATTRVADDYLTLATATAASSAGRDAAISSALQSYDAQLGTVATGDDVSSLLTAFQTAVTGLASTGATSAAQAGVVSAAGQLATAIRGLSGTIQTLRGQASTDIASTVATVNTAADTIASLNDQIVSTGASGGDVTNLEDQRDAALQTLSGALGISYYTTPDNRVQVYTAGGAALVGDQANHLSYTASSTLSAGVTYPGQISGIMLGGQDITSSITTGTIGGLITLRDTTLVGEQAKLDQLATTLIATTNAVSNAGSAYPAPATLTGSVTVTAADSLGASGTLRVAVTTASGTVAATQDFNRAAYPTVGSLVTALNGLGGVSASISPSGKLVLAATDPTQGVALADIGASVGPAGVGVSAYFGLNDVFSGQNATDIAVSAGLQANPASLPTAALPSTATLSVGAVALTSGDSAVADRLNAAISAATTFPTAGGFPAQSTSLQSYASSFVSSAAGLVSGASAAADQSQATFTAAQSRLDNLTNVNTDEELALLTTYEQQYQANAQMVSMVRTMFTALMTMMA
ncbi:flagellar hook-associated protein FlgK [Phenylobacterium hankyongense]|uniref:Flagellar hook-associated protein 1 n=1 Tax=Phenylobacterium hankyongense TaxID=1813876 RepID=A0A328B3M3_9CAUL|nr:flagellar hook-associated protein FlgK [Phenylobacterium hankyongense]RAK59598.1 flagellar hook-associated protein FlgK [Phenylobacterium hankyongense]